MYLNEMQAAQAIGIDLSAFVSGLSAKGLTFESVKSMDETTLKALFNLSAEQPTGANVNSNSDVKPSSIERMTGAMAFNSFTELEQYAEQNADSLEFLRHRTLLPDGLKATIEVTGTHAAPLRKVNAETGKPYTLVGVTGIIRDANTQKYLNSAGKETDKPHNHTCTTLIGSPFYDAVKDGGFDVVGKKFTIVVGVEERTNAEGQKVTYNTYEMV